MWHLTLSRHEPASKAQVERLIHHVEKLMSQVDDLAGILTSIQADVGTVLDHTKALEQQLIHLQETTPPQVDLTGVINQATAIRNQLEGISDGANVGGDTGNSGSSGSTDSPSPPADASGGTDATGADTSAAGDTPIPDAQP